MKKERKKNAKERSSSSYIKEFIPYYKPYKKLLFFDMLCSAIATAVELVFPSFANVSQTKRLTWVTWCSERFLFTE